MPTMHERGWTAVAVSPTNHERLSTLKLKLRIKHGTRRITMNDVVSGLLDYFDGNFDEPTD